MKPQRSASVYRFLDVRPAHDFGSDCCGARGPCRAGFRKKFRADSCWRGSMILRQHYCLLIAAGRHCRTSPWMFCLAAAGPPGTISAALRLAFLAAVCAALTSFCFLSFFPILSKSLALRCGQLSGCSRCAGPWDTVAVPRWPHTATELAFSLWTLCSCHRGGPGLEPK